MPWRCRQRWGLGSCKPRTIWSLQNLEDARKDSPSWTFRGSKALPTAWLWTLGLQDYERINFCTTAPTVVLCYSNPRKGAQVHLSMDSSWDASLKNWRFSCHLKTRMEEGMATHSSTLAWRIPWTEEPGQLQSMGSPRVGHNWVTKH